MKHLGHPKVDCKKAYTKEELMDFEEKKKKRRTQKEVQRQWDTYDRKKRAEKHKKYYEPSKRAKTYQKEKEDQKSYDPEKEKAQPIDKEEFELRQNQRNEYLGKLE